LRDYFCSLSYLSPEEKRMKSEYKIAWLGSGVIWLSLSIFTAMSLSTYKEQIASSLVYLIGILLVTGLILFIYKLREKENDK